MLRKILRILKSGPQSVDDLILFPEGRRIYREFHNLRRDQMDQDALKVINRLNRHGYRSYLVGGCVRDMILGRKPKDFDVVTTATPGQIRKIFSNSRAIGRRFKIVHVVFRGEKIIEVSTFRSLPGHRLENTKKESDYLLQRDNQYGSPREDAARRDFTINALFFDPRNESIIDYVGGFDHILEKKISVIGDPDISFREDPVRMLRAAKFAALLDFQMDLSCLKAIRKNRDEILKASPSRLLEEYNKIFRTGKSSSIFESFHTTGLFRCLFPEAWDAAMVHGSRTEVFSESSIGRRLMVADRMLTEREELTTNIFTALILLDLVHEVFTGEVEENILSFIKTRIEPVCRKMNLSGKDQDRLLQVFVSQQRFSQANRRRRFKPEVFRKKIFFFEAFMVFKINAIAEQNDEAVQQAMFWEIGPRPRPPEVGKIVSVFPVRNRSSREKKGSSEGGKRHKFRTRGARRKGGSGGQERALTEVESGDFAEREMGDDAGGRDRIKTV